MRFDALVRTVQCLLLATACVACGKTASQKAELPPSVVALQEKLAGSGISQPNGFTHPPGKESMYDFLDQGNIETADQILHDTWQLPRFAAVELKPPLRWNENPFDEKYWRFIFYSLRYTRHLLHAFVETGDLRYRDKLVEIFESFSRDAGNSPYIHDKHGVAFRALVLLNSYWKLEERQALDASSRRMLIGLIIDAAKFLVKEENFEGGYNHGVTQAAALLMISENLPIASGVPEWRSLALGRLGRLLEDTIAEDGVQIEQSPGYHFYTLVFFSQIHAWAKRYGVVLGHPWDSKIRGMIRFATHIAQPDGRLPLLGATGVYRVANSSKLSSLANIDPDFSYVHSQGTSGTRPQEASVLFPQSGFSILRSRFAASEDYQSATQVVFDVGPYRTAHSHLDALHLTLFAGGREMLVDSGLYSLEKGPKFQYFHGTRAHNTITIGGKDQAEGSARAGRFVPNSDTQAWAYQSGLHDSLYVGAEHRRGVLLLRENLVIVIDEVTQASKSEVRLNWNFAPDLLIKQIGANYVAHDASEQNVMTIFQTATNTQARVIRGQENPKDGWYSAEYEQELAASTLSFAANSEKATFVTALATGPQSERPTAITASLNDGTWNVLVQTAQGEQAIRIAKLASQGEEIEVTPRKTRMAEPALTPRP